MHADAGDRREVVRDVTVVLDDQLPIPRHLNECLAPDRSSLSFNLHPVLDPRSHVPPGRPDGPGLYRLALVIEESELDTLWRYILKPALVPHLSKADVPPEIHPGEDGVEGCSMDAEGTLGHPALRRPLLESPVPDRVRTP